jgi:hypothetical protein
LTFIRVFIAVNAGELSHIGRAHRRKGSAMSIRLVLNLIVRKVG